MFRYDISLSRVTWCTEEISPAKYHQQNITSIVSQGIISQGIISQEIISQYNNIAVYLYKNN